MHSNFIFRISALMLHVQTLFLLDSMPTKLHLDVLSVEHLSGTTYKPSVRSITGMIKDIIENDANERAIPNSYIFLTYAILQPGVPTTVGIAYEGTICAPDQQPFLKSSVNMHTGDDVAAAETVAHEIGHNLNMKHDFEQSANGREIIRNCPTDGSKCTNVGGFMVLNIDLNTLPILLLKL